jgi:hypothetical protein
MQRFYFELGRMACLLLAIAGFIDLVSTRAAAEPPGANPGLFWESEIPANNLVYKDVFENQACGCPKYCLKNQCYGAKQAPEGWLDEGSTTVRYQSFKPMGLVNGHSHCEKPWPLESIAGVTCWQYYCPELEVRLL